MKQWYSSNNYDGIQDNIRTSEFSKSHHMNKKYGVNRMEEHNFSDGRRWITLDGYTFKDRKFHFSASNSSIREPFDKYLGNFFRSLAIKRNKTVSEETIRVIKALL